MASSSDIGHPAKEHAYLGAGQGVVIGGLLLVRCEEGVMPLQRHGFQHCPDLWSLLRV